MNLGDQVTFSASQNHSFNDLSAYLCSLSMWFLGTATHYGYEPTQAALYRGRPGSVVHPGIALGFDGYPLAEHIVAGTWPDKIVLHSVLDEPFTRPGLRLGTVQRILGAMTTGMYVRYYESIADLLNTNFGPVARRPATLQFARTVRNAFAHGAINIVDGRPSGAWSQTSVSSAENGHSMLFKHLGVADVLLLCADIDRFLGPPAP